MNGALMRINPNLGDFLFRVLFSLIFTGLGMEHIFSDALIQHLMPSWMPFPHFVSIICGIWILFWGTLVMIGFRLHLAAWALGAFVVVVTLIVHLPGVMLSSPISAEYSWMWTILQRSNLAKNLCLLGVCCHLINHKPGRYSVDWYLAKRRRALLNQPK